MAGFIIAAALVLLGFALLASLDEKEEIRPTVQLVIDSVRSKPGWVFTTNQALIGEEASYDPFWFNVKLGLSVSTVDFSCYDDANPDFGDCLFEMNGAEIEAFEEAVEEREMRLLKKDG